MTHIICKLFLYWNYFVPVISACTDRTPLGMANGLIISDQISNSSMYADYLPSRGRLYSSGAWLGRSGTFVGDYQTDWFQVHFENKTIINGVAIQGVSLDVGLFIETFRLEFSINGNDWTRFDNDKNFTGNVDNVNVVYNWFATSMIATDVRLYATRVKFHNTTYVMSCVRMELYGCLQNDIPLPLGMSSGIIKNLQLQHSTGINPAAARLFAVGEGMYRRDSNPMYLQIDFLQLTTVTGISMQGAFGGWRKKYVTQYHLRYSNDSTTFTPSGMKIINNTDLGAVFTSLLKPTTMKHIRITAINCIRSCGMKVEIYGYDPFCSQTLRNMDISTINDSSVTNVDIDSPYAWCATDVSDYVHIAFKKTIVISGIILQGDSNGDGWVKKYKVQYGVSRSKSIQNLIGVPARISLLSVNWLNTYIVTNFLRITPTSCNNYRCCLRFRLKGCQFVLEKPHSIHGSISSSGITFRWKESHPFLVVRYLLSIAASKDYQHNHLFFFPTISVATHDLFYNIPNINFEAARFQVNITAEIQGVRTSAAPYNFYIQPKDPPSPGLDKSDISNRTNNVTIVTLTPSSDINGPISYYEIVISTTLKTTLSKQLTNQKESELKNLTYFLAVKIKADNLQRDDIKYTFVEGKEFITGLNARILTIGTYYLYARAVIDGKDITKYGFNDMSYSSVLSQEVKIERNALSLIIPTILNDTTPSVRLVKGPTNIKFHFIIIMKVNETTWPKKEPTLYKQEELKTYESADYNEPYIAGVFSKAELFNVDEFKLGNNFSYSMPSGSVRKRRSVVAYRNGPLIQGETYVVFQRLQVQDKLYSTSWSKEFDVPVQRENDENDPQPPSSSSKLSLIVGICVSAIIVIIIIGAIIYYKRMAKSPRKESPVCKVDETDDTSNYQDLTQTNQGISPDTYEELQNVTKCPTYEQVPMMKIQQKQMDTSQFSNYFLRQLSCDFKGIRKELNSFAQNYCDYSYSQNNATSSEVIEIQSNQNEMIGYSIFQSIDIGNTIDIWKKIFLQAFPIVVVIKSGDASRLNNLLNCLEGETTKYGDYDVRLCQTIVMKDHTIQKVEISHGKHKHKLCLYEFEVLPLVEYAVSTEYLMNTCRAFTRMAQSTKKAHISFIDNSGSGFYIILIVVIEMMVLIKEKGTVDIYNFFNLILSKISSLNICFEQYLIIHKVIWEFITYGEKYVSVADFQNEYKNFLMSKDDKGRYLFEGEFEEQNKLRKSHRNTFKAASSDLNVSKNRFRGVLAGDNRRVILSQPADYINAVYVDSYQKRNAFIATQAPLEETAFDFWDMVLKENVTTIIMLYTFEERGIDYPVFWSIPKDNRRVLEFKLVSVTMQADILLRSSLVTTKGETHPVNILQFTNWPLNNVPKIEDVKLIVEELEKSQESLDHGTVVVMCSDGAYRSGTFIASMNALEQMKLENGVDVFNIVRCIRQSRPEFILNVHQYRFVYEVVNSFLDNHSAYENIQT